MGKTIGDQTGTVWVGAVVVPLLVPLIKTWPRYPQASTSTRGGHHPLYSSLSPSGYFISLYYGTIGMFIGTAISLFIGQVLMINRYYARTAGLDMRLFRRTYGPLSALRRHDLALGAVALLTLDNWFSFLPSPATPPGRGNHLVLLPQSGMNGTCFSAPCKN
ncbi:MAG: hypothetical protein ACLT8E_02805 [Akkermansia sp.]